ncbi:hypothetical protein [Methanocella conradii]|uniref:hypothetical protein n=1 Tax=Methanocella conradii TaxID=1175444 RepID=UPI00157DFE7B|nr:hypothetical protein [Methanocella conradii]
MPDEIMSPVSDKILEYDLSKMQYSDAARIALNDASVKELLKNHIYKSTGYGNKIYRIESISKNNDNSSGYINSSTSFYKVVLLITGTKDYFDEIKLIITIDMDSKKVVSRESIHKIAWPVPIFVIVPQGSCWYHKLVVPSSAILKIEPNNATTYVSIFNEYNFNNLLAGKPYNAHVYDGIKREWINTTMPFEGNVSTGVGQINKIPFDINETNYMVIKNVDNQNVSFELSI